MSLLRLISVALLVAPLVLSGVALAADSASKDEAVAMVKKAVAAIKSEGREKAYAEIDTIPNKVAQMQNAGYLPIATFIVPESCWTNYYSITQKTHASFLKKYSGNKTAEEFVGYQRHEAELYYKYKAYYGYVFYVGKKI